MLKPAYKVKIGPETYDSTTSSEIVSINIDCDINIPLDIFKIVFKPGDKAGSIKKGDLVTIELGYEGSTSKVFTGAIDAVEPRVGSTVASGYSVAATLTRLKIHQIYEKQTAGAIIKDLVQRPGLAVKDASDGISFPMYVVDDSKSVYDHMLELAQLCGFDLFMTNEGTVMFKKFEEKKPSPFKYGRDILKATVQQVTPSYTGVKVFEESPSSTKGEDTAHWLSDSVLGGTAGSGDQWFTIRHPAIRDKDSADKVAVAKLESLLVSLKGMIMTIGNPKVGLGGTIEIKEMPDERMNGKFEVVRASHAFNMEQGYVSTFGWIKKVDVSAGEPPMVAPPSVPAPPKPPGPLDSMLQDAQGALDGAKEQLVEAVESAQDSLDGLLEEVNAALAEVDKQAAAAIEAAKDAKKTADDAANKAFAYVEQLKQQLADKKKELDGAIASAQSEYEEAKKKAEEPIKKLEEEGAKLKKEAEDKAKELEDKVKEAIKPVEDEISGIKDKIKDAKESIDKSTADISGMNAQLSAPGAGDQKTGLEDKIKELENKAKEYKEKAEKYEEELESKTKIIDDKKKEAEQKLGDLKKDLADKLKQGEDKVEEEKKKAEDALKSAEDKVKEAKKKLDDGVKEVQGQIDEAEATAKKLVKEANEGFDKAVKGAEDARKDAAKAVDGLKSSYKSARDTVMSSRKQLGLD
jgi:predicted  nucleic acid-binding Zn-ribbon protein